MKLARTENERLSKFRISEGHGRATIVPAVDALTIAPRTHIQKSNMYDIADILITCLTSKCSYHTSEIARAWSSFRDKRVNTMQVPAPCS